MSILVLQAYPQTALISAAYDSNTVAGIGTVTIEAADNTVVDYTVTADQCITKTGSHTIEQSETVEIILSMIGSVSVDTWVPATGKDTFPTHLAKLGKGGWREVSTIEERDAIVPARREAGMAVYVVAESKVYILNNDLTTWSEFKSGNSDAVIRKTSDFNTFTPLFDGEIVQYIGSEESESSDEYVTGYFYQAIPNINYETTVEFTPREGTETVVTISPEDFTTFIETWCEGRPFTAEEVTHGNIGIYSSTSYAIDINTDDGQFAYASFEISDLEAAGFTFNPLLGSQQGVDFVCEINKEIKTYTYSQIDVQPQTDLVWGNITGTLSDQTDLNTALSGKVSTTSEANKVYGTDNQGDQTIYDVDSFGKVDDVKIGNTSLVSNKIATIPSADASTLGVSKLYTTTGSNTDGSITQAAITTELDTKVDKASGNNLLYGTNAQGEQTTYNKTDFLVEIRNWELE